MRYLLLAFFIATSALSAEKPGYTDTPLIPGQKWKVHDSERPYPPVIAPSEKFSDGAKPPGDAIVLFDGTDLSKWTGAKWKVENGYMEVNKTGSLQTKDKFGDFQLHLEWAAPAEVKNTSQARGNSGVIIYGRYEIQVLDSWNNPTYADGTAGAIYGQNPPLANASRKPGEWQTYDIIFETPRWEADKQTKPGSVTVIHNGVVVQHRQEILGSVSHRGLPKYSKHAPEGIIQLQDHGDPMRFRNIWIRHLGERDAAKQ